MNDLIQPRNMINEVLRETACAGQHDRKILSTVYRMFTSHPQKMRLRLNRLMEARYTRFQA